ncbi:MAG: beta-lactamase family protein [Clostridia bacterium]|nr:beta-lactamase family protein [Clostridia bacterium]
MIKSAKILCLCLVLVTMFLGMATSVMAETTVALDTKKIDEVINSEMQRLGIPGASVAIVNKDQIVYLKGYGKANPDGTPVTPQTPFLLGSISKSFTAVAIMQLVEQGKVKLDLPIQQYLPWFQLADKEASKIITVRHLLSQTSGLSGYDGRILLADKSGISITEAVRKLNTTNLNKPVGAAFEYSELNYVILGEIIQSVSGVPYETYIQKNIFEPLEMNHSFYSESEAKKNGLATGYQSVFGFIRPTYVPFRKALLPSGFLISSGEDMAKYLIANITGGTFKNKAILSTDGMKQIHSPSTQVANFYGMGWFVYGSSDTHDGDLENYHVHMETIKNKDWGIALLTNFNDHAIPSLLNEGVYNKLHNSIVNIVLNNNTTSEGSQSSLTIGKFYLNFNIVFILITIAFIVCILRLLSWKRRFKLKPTKIIFFALRLCIFNVLIPIVLLKGIPIAFFTPWPLILMNVPTAYFLLAIPIALLLLGLFKVILFVSFMISNKKSSVNA